MNNEKIKQILEEAIKSGRDIDGDVIFSNGKAYLVYADMSVAKGCDTNDIF